MNNRCTRTRLIHRQHSTSSLQHLRGSYQVSSMRKQHSRRPQNVHTKKVSQKTMQVHGPPFSTKAKLGGIINGIDNSIQDKKRQTHGTASLDEAGQEKQAKKRQDNAGEGRPKDAKTRKDQRQNARHSRRRHSCQPQTAAAAVPY